jgi:hypothetical protein
VAIAVLEKTAKNNNKNRFFMLLLKDSYSWLVVQGTCAE